MAARLDVAVISITHHNKSQGGSANHKVIGSIAFVAAARAAYLVAADPEDESRRLFLPTKNNLGPSKYGLSFRVETKDVKDGITPHISSGMMSR